MTLLATTFAASPALAQPTTPTGSLRVVVGTTGGDGTFAFTATGGHGLPSSFSVATAGGAAQAVFLVDAGVTLSLAAPTPAGWRAVSAACDAGAPASFSVPANGTRTCTFAFARLGALEVRATFAGGNASTLVSTNATGAPASTTLTGVDGSATARFENVTPGAHYAISASVPAGWFLTSAACSDGAPTGFRVTPGNTTTCTFSFSRNASLVVRVRAHGGSGTFSFNATGAGLPGSFSLVTNGDGRASTSFGNLDPGAGARTLSPHVPAGWHLASASCDRGTPTAIVIVAANATTCTFTYQAADRDDHDDDDDDDRDRSEARECRGRGFGVWKEWSRHRCANETTVDGWVRNVSASSAWLLPTGYAATADGASELLRDATKHCRREFGALGCERVRFEARYLVLRLQMEAGLVERADDARLSRGAGELLGLPRETTVGAVVDAIERLAGGTAESRGELHDMRVAVQAASHGDPGGDEDDD